MRRNGDAAQQIEKEWGHFEEESRNVEKEIHGNRGVKDGTGNGTFRRMVWFGRRILRWHFVRFEYGSIQERERR